MIGPFGRQGPAASLRKHCPQMTLRLCITLSRLPISEWTRGSEADDRKDGSKHEGDYFILRGSSPSLSLALSNRASCLLRAGHFAEALEDVDLALWAGYPQEKLHR